MFIFGQQIGDVPCFHAARIHLFQFQKPYGSSAILLPDIDFLGLDFYHQPGYVDQISYQDKATSAIFVGGSSGQTNTVETIREPVAQRLKAAIQFPVSDFRRHTCPADAAPGARTQKQNKHSVTWALAAPGCHGVNNSRINS